MISLKYLLGRKVDHFILDEIIGRGAMGTVFKATDTILDRTVALKLILKGDEAPISSEAQKRLIREAQAAGRLSHPNIVTVYCYGETDEFQYISMEYVTGRNLAQVVAEKRKLELAESLDIMEQVLDAMVEASREGIVHRDIKPSNILLTRDGRVKVTDFGLARLNTASSLTMSGTILGTPHYMSPEQILGQQADIRSDIFSAGVVMYELLCGVKPFNGDSLNAIIYKIVNSEPAPISTHDIKVPDFTAGIINKAITKDVHFRYQTPEEMLADIITARQLSSPPVKAEDATIVRPPARKATTAPGGRVPETGAVPRAATGSGAGRLILPGVLLAGGAGILALFLYMKSPTVAPPAHAPGTQAASSSQTTVSPGKDIPVPHDTRSPSVPEPVMVEKKLETPTQAVVEHSAPSHAPVQITEESRETGTGRQAGESKASDNRQATGSGENAPVDLAVPAGGVPEGNRAESTGSDDNLLKAPVSIQTPAQPAEPAKPRDDGRAAARTMLARAENAFREDRILSPEGDNALVFYEQAFALDGESEGIYASVFSAVERSISRAKIAAGNGDNASAKSFVDRARKILQVIPKPPLKQYQASLRKYEAETGSILKNLAESTKQKTVPKPRTRVQRQETPPRPTVLKEDLPAGNRILKEDFPAGKKILKEDFPAANR